MNVLKTLVFIMSINSVNAHSFTEKFNPYELIELPKGSFMLSIPEKTFLGVNYFKKNVVFNHNIEIGRYEVTNRQWNICFKLKGCSKPAKIRKGESLDSPVVRINWHDAYEYSRWLSDYTGENYRLPTEEEWVYAASMGQDRQESVIVYDYSDLAEIRKISKLTKPVGTFNDNQWGMFDFQGNVWEWTLTCWYASKENVLKQTDAKTLNSPSACTTRIAQGENRSHIPDFISDTYNGGCATLRPAANLGFRLVRE